jgi:regulator of sigma E protease
LEIFDITSLAFLDTIGFRLLTILIVIFGLGLVIFFHELGHFLVAKWCNVYVERFSIGFGQPILAKKWGETEYVLGWLPLGGYVKMMGQDDMDPGQMTDEQVAENPRSYTAKNVPQRMAIISAGVIMNIITGMMFFAIAFSWGIESMNAQVGMVHVGMPAWQNGMRTGDTITAINDRQISEFNDILRRTTLSRGPIEISGHRITGETYDITVQPEKTGIRRIIGVAPPISLTVIDPPASMSLPVAYPGTAAARAEFLPGDEIQAIDGEPVASYVELLERLGKRADQAVEVTVAGKADSTGDAGPRKLRLPAEPFQGLGLKMGMGKIVAIQNNSPAAKAGLLRGDRIAKVNDLDVENDLDPYRLTEIFSEHAGEEVSVTVTREVAGGSPEAVRLTIVPEDRNPWSEPPVMEESPLSIPSIGVAYHLVPTVFSVREGSPAASAGIKSRDTVTKMELVRPPAGKKDGFEEETVSISIGEKNWAYAFWTIQEYARTRHVELTVTSAGSDEETKVELKPDQVEGWYLPTTRGLKLSYARELRVADNTVAAMGLGIRHTVNTMEDIYLTLRGLFTRDISYKGLSGPIGIAKIAYDFASVGLPHFLLFLGLISVNLAVINFLPIPVLDGGHMVFLIWEGLFRRKPSEAVVATATYFGLAFVLGLMVFVIYLDLFVPKE